MASKGPTWHVYAYRNNRVLTCSIRKGTFDPPPTNPGRGSQKVYFRGKKLLVLEVPSNKINERVSGNSGGRYKYPGRGGGILSGDEL